jgi:flagellar hook-associated protein 2
VESISLIDAVYSARLTAVGLPALANVQEASTGVAPVSDPYAAPSSSVTQLSGFGQLLSATSRANDGFKSLLGDSTNLASSSASSVATGSATSGAAVASYAVNVTQTAQADTFTSGVFADDSSTVFTTGSFTLTVGSADPVTVTLSDATSLQGLADAINAASAGVTASVSNGTYGYTLTLAADTSGAANTVTFGANPDDPLDGGADILQTLGLTKTATAQDAAYTIDSVAGTSTSNDDIVLADNATFSIVGTGSATISVATTPTIPADSDSVTSAATAFVQTYNALIGTSAQLLASGGALDGDSTTASPLSTAIYNATQATYSNGSSALTTLAQLGITGTGVSTGALSLDSTTLASAFAGDASGAASLLTTLTSTLQGILGNYLGDTGTILTQAKTTEQNMTFIDGQAASSYPYLTSDTKQYLLQKSLSNASTPIGLPEISVFA